MVDRIVFLLRRDNALFRKARDAKRLPNIFLATVMHLVFMVAGLGITLLSLVLFLGDWGSAQSALQESGGFLAAFAGMIVALFVWVRCFEKRTLRSIGLEGPRILPKYLSGFGIGALMLMLVVGLMFFSGNVVTDHNGPGSVGGAAVLAATLLGLLAWVVQGGTEEVITRGWYMGVLGARYGPWVGVTASTLLFAILHLTANPVAVLNLSLFGLFLALYCLREGSVWGVCGWHSAWNLTQVKVFGLAVSGRNVQGGALMDLKAEGNPYLSGGDFGPEGSVYATLIFVVGIAVVLLLTKAEAPATR